MVHSLFNAYARYSYKFSALLRRTNKYCIVPEFLDKITDLALGQEFGRLYLLKWNRSWFQSHV